MLWIIDDDDLEELEYPPTWEDNEMYEDEEDGGVEFPIDDEGEDD
jgi:hypothetical protein